MVCNEFLAVATLPEDDSPAENEGMPGHANWT